MLAEPKFQQTPEPTARDVLEILYRLFIFGAGLCADKLGKQRPVTRGRER
jgi:hypothetical protein